MNPDLRTAEQPLDVIIVGGGSAGLTAALILGRCLRRVLVLDAGRPRNAAARRFHGYLSRDDTTPSEFLNLGREELKRYVTVSLRRAEVVQAAKSADGFAVTLDSGESVSAKLLLLATGLVDELPPIKGLGDIYGQSAHSCSICDAWEHRGQPLAVVGADRAAVDLAIELRLWSEDVALCSNGNQLDPRFSNELRAAGLTLHESQIECLESAAGQLNGVRFTNGQLLVRSALFFSPGQHQRSALAESLGCDFVDGAYIRCDDKGSTSVPGLFAAGNASQGVELVVAAAAEGACAALAINNALLG